MLGFMPSTVAEISDRKKKQQKKEEEVLERPSTAQGGIQDALQ